jgi:hypothetical protein
MNTSSADALARHEHFDSETPVSAVSWGAIWVGAVSAAALALILIALGTGLGFASVSPWAGQGMSATSFTIATAVWLLAVQVITSGVGGYVAGRLRVRWVGTHTDEVFFRDTAHGLAAWAVAAIVGASLLTSGAGALLGTVTSAAGQAGGALMGTAGVAGGAAAASADAKMPTDYASDLLMRGQKSGTDMKDATPEIGRILAAGAAKGEVSTEDKAYLAMLVAERTGIDQAQAEQRVNDVLAKVDAAKREAKQAADAARKGAALLSLWVFISLLGGAFTASLMATFGGRQRDRV